MNTGGTWKLISSVMVMLTVLFGMGWLFIRALKKSDDAARLIFKWVLTLGVCCFIFYVVCPMIAKGGMEAALVGIPTTLVCGLVLAIIWRHSLADLVAKPFGSLYDGGDQVIEVRALYSKAEKFRQRNQFSEAINAIREELAKFPDDFTGQMLLAEINAENLHDLQSARIIVEKIVEQPGHTPAQLAGALHALADWHTKLAQDPESARLILEQIVERFPASSFSQMAAQRIAHLSSVDRILESHNRPTFALKHFDPYASLENPSSNEEALPPDAATRALECLKQLEKHPLDTEAREKLAMIYAHDYQRLDLAADEIEQLVSQSNHPPKQIVRWLNLLADWQIKIGNDVLGAQKTIQRIPELFPNAAYADQAILRLEYLRLQAKRNETSQDVKFGTYEKNLGLKKPF